MARQEQATKPAPVLLTESDAELAPMGALSSSQDNSPTSDLSRVSRKQAPANGAFVAQQALNDIVSPQPQPDRDRFANPPENTVQITTEAPVSTFSIDVDTASYAYMRSTLLNGGTVRPDAIRVEEMVNYFTYDYAAPSDTETPFSTRISVT